MTLPTFNPPVRPHAGTQNKPAIKVLKAEFGDGYTQSTGDGINNVRKVYVLRWDNIRDADADPIVDFMEARKGYEPFYFQLRPTRPALKFTCEDWSTDFQAAGRQNVTATLRQTFILDT